MQCHELAHSPGLGTLIRLQSALRSGHLIRDPSKFTNRPRLSMSTDSGQDDLPKILARAFVRAWDRFCEADSGGKLSEDVARLFLKGFLVGFAREGVTDEEQLVADGLQHLISVARKPTSSKCSTKEQEKTAEDGGRHLHFCINEIGRASCRERV